MNVPARRPYGVLDVDGVLADVRHRLHHVEDHPKNWAAFFAAAPLDPPLPEGLAVASQLASDHEVVYLTGRPERCRADTEEWLRRQGLPAGAVRMRSERDHRPARLVKLAVLRELSRQRPVAVLVDDDPLVCRAARRAGFTVLQADWMPRPPSLLDAQERDGRS